MILAGNPVSVISNSKLVPPHHEGNLELRQPSLQGGGAALRQLPKVAV